MRTTNRTMKLAALVASAIAPLASATAAQALQIGPITILGPPGPPSTPTSPATAAASPVPSMLQVEQHLAHLRFDPGPLDGVFDDATSEAVTAFQKSVGIERTGQVTDPVARAILATTTPTPPLQPGGGPNRVEVDLTRQILMVYEGDALSRILPISSGTAETPTPTGSYRIYRQATGWETSPLGQLYNSQYFVGGYALHGSLSVPPHPASHGCVRIPMRAADWLPNHVGIGTPVYVMGG